MCGLDVTAMLRFDAEKREQLAERGLPLTDALTELYELWGHETPVLFDPMALCMAIDSSFCEIEMRRVVVTDEGVTQIVEGAPSVGVCVKPDVDRFFEFYIQRVVKPE
jgi:inosine-uridine nucleoside N-ribohydrolase